MKRDQGTDSERRSREPTPLVTGDGAAADVLRAAMANTAPNSMKPPRGSARAAPSQPRRRAEIGVYLGLGLAAGVAFLLLGKPRPPVEGAPGPVAVAPPEATAPAVREPLATTDEPKVVRPTDLPRSLGEGKTRLSDGSLVRVASHSEASVRQRPEEGTTIDLTRGSLDVEVAPQTGDCRVEVVSGMYHFVALGTQFHVSVASDRVELEVVEGTVGVFTGSKLLARVEPGTTWSSASPSSPRGQASGEPAFHPGNTPPVEPTGGGTTRQESGAEAPDCAALGRSGNTQSALDCYGKQAARSGMAGELALYEIARLRKDVLSDYAGALDALKTYDTRFPNGSLRGEVQVSRVELLGRLGRNDEALAESARLLDTPWGKERAPDLHLLRGNLYRQSLRDFARAEAEYARVSDNHGPAGDEAQFQRAFCLERLGQAPAALHMYESYLKRPHPRHAAEAKARVPSAHAMNRRDPLRFHAGWALAATCVFAGCRAHYLGSSEAPDGGDTVGAGTGPRVLRAAP